MGWKQWRQQKLFVLIVSGLGITSFVVGALVSLTVKPGQDSQFRWTGLTNSEKELITPNRIGAPSPIVSEIVTTQPIQKRVTTLQQVAKSAAPSLDRNRARYVLASDLIAEGRGQEALEPLQNLETDYPVMAAQILLKRAQAYEAAGQTDQMIATCRQLVQQYPQAAATAEALFILGKQTPADWDRLLAQFPAHPRSIEVAKTRLRQNPKQFDLQLLLAKYDLESTDYSDRTEQFVKTFGSRLTPLDWQAVAFGFWENQKYGPAAVAYSHAPESALTLYRSARGLQLAGQPGSRDRYRLVVQRYPGTPEAGLALTRLAKLTDKPPEAIAYLDQLIEKYPDRAAQAMADKAKLLDQLKSTASASQLRQGLLAKYSNSEAAASVRWQMAQEQAKAGNLPAAKQWAEAILVGNPQSPIAAQAGFWAGKWATQLGQNSQASSNFQSVIKLHPDSYYAWRSATRLGWNVGDFDRVRQLQPQVVRPKLRPELPAGSETLRELHQLGQDRDAWADWQVEFKDRQQPTVAEQFTDGVLRLGVGDNLDGIFMVSNLNDRDKPSDQQQVSQLRQEPGYWEALYPFPYLKSIENWAQQRQLNPMLVTALIRQESRFEPKIRSGVGATGLMQVMPETASFIASQIKLKTYKLDNPDDNIKLGTWYLDYTHDQYGGNSMLAVASYNAGPGAVGDWLAKSKTQDADAFVEAIPYDETRGYVKSVFENYWNYLRLYNPEISQKVAQVSPLQKQESLQ